MPKKPSNPDLLAENEAFVRLVQVAKEDNTVRDQLIQILSLDSFNRISLLNSMVSSMIFGTVPKGFPEAIASLKDDAVAGKLLRLLKNQNPI